MQLQKLLLRHDLLAALILGALLGLCAPGIGLWFYAWIGLAPLIILIASSKNMLQALLRAFLFGLAYNYVYMQWYFGLVPLDWLGFNQWQGNLMAATALLVVAAHQALIIALFALFFRLVSPLIAKNNQIFMPALWVVPLLWVIIVNKLGNAHDLIGVPWSMLEYSQYKQLPLIQVANLIGGIGINYIIVLCNVAVAIMLATRTGLTHAKAIYTDNPKTALYQGLIAVSLIVGMISYGFWQLSQKEINATTRIYALQDNVNIEMQKGDKRYTVDDLFNQELELLSRSKANNGLCVWPEGALPAKLTLLPLEPLSFTQKLSQLATTKQMDLLVGAIDQDTKGNFYNGAFGISSNGNIFERAYRKRYLVPFGEYTPELVKYMPEWIRRLTNTPAGSGYTSGNQPIVLNFATGKIAPLICFETISPELAASSVRAGGELLINISDLAWFHKSIVGEQMLAFAVLRAVENQRYFVFAANTGPSAIITPTGEITARTPQSTKEVLTGKVGFNPHTSFFTRWFVF